MKENSLPYPTGFVKPAILLIGLPGLLTLLFATRWGVGLTPDALVYVGSARSLLDGYGLALAVGGLDHTPITHHAPFYPFLLSLLTVGIIDPLVVARWLNAFLLGMNGLMVWAVVSSHYSVVSSQAVGDREVDHRLLFGRWLPLVGGLLLLVAPMLEVHAFALTEPLFLLLLVGSVWFLARYLTAVEETTAVSPLHPYLIYTAILLALACLTRYAGLAFVGAAVLALFFFDNGSWRQRLGRGLLFGLLAGLPLGLWLLRNRLLTGTGTSRQLFFHPIHMGHIQQAVDTFSSWLLLPLHLPGLVKLGLLALLLVVGTGLLWWVYGRSLPPLFKLLGLFSLVYLLFLAVSISFVDANTPLDHRILSPIYLMGVVGGMGALTAVYTHKPLPSYLQLGGVGLLLLFLTAQGVQSAGWVQQVHQDGLGFNQRVWQQSALLAEVRALPPDVVLYSNAPSAVHFLAGRPVQALPRQMEATTQQPNPNYQLEMVLLQERFAAETAVVVYITVLPGGSAPTEAELQETLNLHPQTRLPEGVLYVTR